jgi:xanthine dehydrogenase accessory factor
MQSNIEWLKQLRQFTQKGEPLAIITITDVKGSSPRAVGAKMFVGSAGRLWGTIGGGKLEETVILDAQNILSSNIPRKLQYPLSEKAGQCCGGSVEVLIEPLNTGPHLYIFGAGHVGTALANTMVNTIFQLHVIDERQEWCLSPAIHQDVQRHSMAPLDFVNSANWVSTKSWAIVMTHDHGLDQTLIQQLSQLKLAYLGLIGSHTKWRRFRTRLIKEGVNEELLNKVHCPVGIDIGGETPQEIAISISAEVIKLYYDELETKSSTKIIETMNNATSETADSNWTSIENDPCEAEL